MKCKKKFFLKDRELIAYLPFILQIFREKNEYHERYTFIVTIVGNVFLT